MKIAIVDQQNDFETIENKLKSIDDFDIAAYHFISLQAMEKSHILFDLFIMEVDITDGDGIYYAQNNLDKKIVFFSHHIHRIKEAFGSNVYGFIEKSDSDEYFIKTMTKILNNMNGNDIISFKIENMQYDFQRDGIPYLQYIRYRTVSFVYLGVIYVIKGYSLKDVKRILGKNFIYVNRETLINKNEIADYIEGVLYIKNIKTSFEVSLRRRSKVKSIIRKRG